jgi:ribosomal peptide maturation radical SAM protein 1
MDATAAARPFRLVVAPFFPSQQPALGISSIAAELKRHGYPATIRYLNVEFGREVGHELACFIERGASKDVLIGEMIFARALWGDAAPDWPRYREQLILSANSRGAPSGRLSRARIDAIGLLYESSCAIVDSWADSLLADRPRVLGFTSSFQQNTASLAIAKRIRMRASAAETLIVFGGANCEMEMGRALADNFSFIDHVVSGEGERTVVDIARAAYAESDGGGRLPRFIHGAAITDLDTLPYPDFDDYFRAIGGTVLEGRASLAAESSRGCWWGEKSHCTFCGLNGATMRYRSKAPARFLDEVRVQQRRYQTDRFAISDNIMSLDYLTTVMPALIDRRSQAKFFYETKANLKKEQLALMAAAGVCAIQPGIESFSTRVLKLMGKGTSLLQNVQLLKWCKEFGIEAFWGIIYGFPREPVEEYATLAELVSSLVHLPAPAGSWPVRVDRFSPYWRSPEQYGLVNLRQSKGYDMVYAPLPPEERKRLAYFFDHEHADGRRPWSYFAPAAAEIGRWREIRSRGPVLELIRDADGCKVRDTRWSDHVRPTGRVPIPGRPCGASLPTGSGG